MTLDDYLREKRALVDAALDRHLPPNDTPPSVIHEAMRYAVLGGGKRIRPILAIAAADACGVDATPFLQQIAALELIHTYSLVHDDLPALDNDDLRRGRKTTHVVFGEAMGILAGDALLTEAFSWLSAPGGNLRAIHEVAVAIDSKGMIGGQVADIEATGTAEQTRMSALQSGAQTFLSALRFIHENKTGKLLTASVVLGGILANANEEKIAALRRYGHSVGLAFQIVDDLLDIEADAATLGKTAGKDVAQGKLTYPSLVGVESARAEAQRLLEDALRNADIVAGPAQNYLAPLARYICSRNS
jgi:geranylgeranyl diphosphate synthase type II